eukprot:gene7364-1315_t
MLFRTPSIAQAYGVWGSHIMSHLDLHNSLKRLTKSECLAWLKQPVTSHHYRYSPAPICDAHQASGYSYTTMEQCASGVAYMTVLHKLAPDKVSLSKAAPGLFLYAVPRPRLGLSSGPAPRAPCPAPYTVHRALVYRMPYAIDSTDLFANFIPDSIAALLGRPPRGRLAPYYAVPRPHGPLDNMMLLRCPPTSFDPCRAVSRFARCSLAAIPSSSSCRAPALRSSVLYSADVVACLSPTSALVRPAASPNTLCAMAVPCRAPRRHARARPLTAYHGAGLVNTKAKYRPDYEANLKCLQQAMSAVGIKQVLSPCGWHSNLPCTLYTGRRRRMAYVSAPACSLLWSRAPRWHLSLRGPSGDWPALRAVSRGLCHSCACLLAQDFDFVSVSKGAMRANLELCQHLQTMWCEAQCGEHRLGPTQVYWEHHQGGVKPPPPETSPRRDLSTVMDSSPALAAGEGLWQPRAPRQPCVTSAALYESPIPSKSTSLNRESQMLLEQYGVIGSSPEQPPAHTASAPPDVPADSAWPEEAYDYVTPGSTPAPAPAPVHTADQDDPFMAGSYGSISTTTTTAPAPADQTGAAVAPPWHRVSLRAPTAQAPAPAPITSVTEPALRASLTAPWSSLPEDNAHLATSTTRTSTSRTSTTSPDSIAPYPLYYAHAHPSRLSSISYTNDPDVAAPRHPAWSKSSVRSPSLPRLVGTPSPSGSPAGAPAPAPASASRKSTSASGLPTGSVELQERRRALAYHKQQWLGEVEGEGKGKGKASTPVLVVCRLRPPVQSTSAKGVDKQHNPFAVDRSTTISYVHSGTKRMEHFTFPHVFHPE